MAARELNKHNYTMHIMGGIHKLCKYRLSSAEMGRFLFVKKLNNKSEYYEGS